MNRRADQKSTIILLFTSILIVGVFSFIGITFINSLDNARTFSARAEWRNEALMLANRFVSDPECIGYSKIIAKYSNETGTDLLIKTRTTVPLAIDRDKAIIDNTLNVKRLTDCLTLKSPEYRMYFEAVLSQYDKLGDIEHEWRGANMESEYHNNQTSITVQLPVKIIDDNGFDYGLFTVTLSVSAEYMQAKVL